MGAKNSRVDANSEQVSRKLLMKVADQLTSEWRDVGRYLGLSESDIQNISANQHRDEAEAKKQMLFKFKQEKGIGATHEALVDALSKAGRLDLAQSLFTGAELSMLVKALKEEYRKRYSGIQPIPLERDIYYCVNDIFVESRIEELNNSKSKIDPSRWTSIKSRHEIFTKRQITLIEGEPGFGKSTLLLQYAYDWCTSAAESPLKDCKIFILLCLKDVTSNCGIYDAIKKLLPDDLPLTSQDIKDIITSNDPVAIALDSYDEYSGMNDGETDINKIREGHMLTHCTTIITARPSCVPKLLLPTVKHCKLTSFDQDMKESYIDKAGCSDMKEPIMRELKENDILSNICQVPFFFTIYAHMKCTVASNQEINSITGYFTFMSACFFRHLENKYQSGNEESTENPAHRLLIAKLAFDGLINKEQRLDWRKDELLTRLRPCYNQYVDAGILLEEERGRWKVIPGSHADDKMEVTTCVRFFHKTFQEFYAAHYLAHLAEERHTETMQNILSKFDLYNNQYVMRFACGLKPKAARVVQEYLNTLGRDGEIFAILCNMEQKGGVANSTIVQQCSRLVKIGYFDSRFLLRSTIQLLQTASQKNITISGVSLDYCFDFVKLKNQSLCLSSGFHLPRLDTLRELEIWGAGDLRDKARDILDYSARCVALKTVKFSTLCGVLLPQLFDDKSVLASLHEKECKVQWFAFQLGKLMLLNLHTGKWEKKNGQEMTPNEYRRVCSLSDPTNTMSEPRLTIRNVATNNILYVGSSGEATTSSEDVEGKRAALFKVQCCERIGTQIAKTVLIRSDIHPQPLLDVRNLHYQGRVLDMKKCFERNRWWKLTWLEIAEGGVPTVLFKSYTEGTYLVERDGGTGVDVLQLEDITKDAPDRAKWKLTIGDFSWTPHEAAVAYIGPYLPTLDAIIREAKPTTNDVSTSAAAVGMTVARAPDTVDDGLSVATATVPFDMLKGVSKALFVDW